VIAEQPHQNEARGRILLFRPRASKQRTGNPDSAGRSAEDHAAVADLAKYEGSEGPDDFRHRMITNAIAFIFIVMLTATGIWLAEAISSMWKNQDCLLSGRRNCAPIDVHARNR
jgi:hypothetical protein